jgi:hypothetical protein
MKFRFSSHVGSFAVIFGVIDESLLKSDSCIQSSETNTHWMIGYTGSPSHSKNYNQIAGKGGYGWWVNGHALMHNLESINYNTYGAHIQIKEGDIVEMIVDMNDNERNIRYKYNDCDLGILAVPKLPARVRPCVGLYTNETIEIISSTKIK